jgi:hypothetical protein
MTNQDYVASLTVGPDPRCSLASLLELARLLQASGL